MRTFGSGKLTFNTPWYTHVQFLCNCTKNTMSSELLKVTNIKANKDVILLGVFMVNFELVTLFSCFHCWLWTSKYGWESHFRGLHSIVRIAEKLPPSFASNINPFHTTGIFRYPLKIWRRSENHHYPWNHQGGIKVD